ncbi:type II toxin-antitoxin system RelE/ParE family toxin [Granulicella rosea]|uniref:type II toxin-antitoxin system RelE/ParE family toxin n=1 Tax=Granulicella rosea TaxID=474952 RepID=UPI001C3C5628|nr:type II toxin-antitoxin system RelE/ParE family toxin [Granulicella rosea]
MQNEAKPIRVAVIAATRLLQQFGPLLHRPYVDTLKGSAYPNMKEFRTTLPDGEWRIAFAFDPQRRGIMLTGATKSGVGQDKFYERLIHIADRRYADHLTGKKTK